MLTNFAPSCSIEHDSYRVNENRSHHVTDSKVFIKYSMPCFDVQESHIVDGTEGLGCVPDGPRSPVSLHITHANKHQLLGPSL